MIRAKGKQDWTPNSLEKRCLHDLDSEHNWTHILKRSRPPESEVQGMRPFWRIFAINVALFILVLAVVFFTIEIGFGGMAEAREDFVGGMIVDVVLASGLAWYVMALYRRSWNRRAAARLSAELLD